MLSGWVDCPLHRWDGWHASSEDYGHYHRHGLASQSSADDSIRSPRCIKKMFSGFAGARSREFANSTNAAVLSFTWRHFASILKIHFCPEASSWSTLLKHVDISKNQSVKSHSERRVWLRHLGRDWLHPKEHGGARWWNNRRVSHRPCAV